MNFLERMRAAPNANEIAKASKAKAEEERERRRIERLLDGVETVLLSGFWEFIKSLRNPYVLQEIGDLLEREDYGGAMKVVDSYIVRFGQTVPSGWASVGAAEATALSAQLADTLKPTVAISFEVGNAVAADLIQRATMKFIAEITEKQREAIQLAMADALASGASSASAARAFRDAIGLTAFQNRAVMRYRTLLEKRSLQAFDRALRDTRFQPRDGTDEARLAYLARLTPEKIDIMVDRYRERMLQRRAETIARTEGLAITEGARDEAFRQMVETTGLDTSLIDEIWRATTSDDRTRETHRAMNGQVQPYGQPFVSPSGARLRYPGDPDAPAEEVINCRCHKTRRIRQVGQPFGTPL